MITIKDLIPMECIGYTGYDDEWHSNNNYQKFIKIDKHHYHVNIYKYQKNEWRLLIYLCLTARNSDNIKIFTYSCKTMKELKSVAVEQINKYHCSDKCYKDIQEWKKTHGERVYDKDFNYLGLTYTSVAREQKPNDFDYINDEKPYINCGIYYQKGIKNVAIYDIGAWGHSCSWSDKEELMSNLN